MVKKKKQSEVLEHFGSSIRMYMNVVFPTNLSFLSHSNIENTQTVGNVSVENQILYIYSILDSNNHCMPHIGIYYDSINHL